MQEGNNIAGAAEPPRKNPCGQTDCCAVKSDFSPGVVPARTASEDELAEHPGNEQYVIERHTHRDRVIAVHEAGHAIHALACNVTIDHVRVGAGDGHCYYTAPSFEGLDELVNALAGPVAGAIVARCFGHYYYSASRYLEMARAGETGRCDGCDVMRRLVKLIPDKPDEVLVALYRNLWRDAVTFFDDINVRIQLFRVADVLQRERLLYWKQLEPLVDIETLKAVRASIYPPKR
jgi:hypothetical protein